MDEKERLRLLKADIQSRRGCRICAETTSQYFWAKFDDPTGEKVKHAENHSNG